MKQFFLGFAALAVCALAQSAPASVFIMPMPGGFDQYLAVQISGTSQYRVVTDPAQATLILTDHVDENLGKALEDITAEHAPPATPAKDGTDTFTRPRMQAITDARGTLFLIDKASHQVLWSTFEEAKTAEAKAMNRAAQRIVQRMTQAAGKAPKP